MAAFGGGAPGAGFAKPGGGGVFGGGNAAFGGGAATRAGARYGAGALDEGTPTLAWRIDRAMLAGTGTRWPRENMHW